MAGENLGTAVLTLDVDLTSIQSGLNKAKTLVENKKFDLTFSTSKAQESFRVLQNSASTLERQLSNIRSTPLKLDTKGLAKLPEDAAKAGVELSKLTRDILNGDKAVANSIAGIQQQARAFQTLAANVKIGSAEFVNFTQAAAKVSQRQLFGGFEEIGALQKLFKLGGFGGFDTFKGTDDLLKFATQVGDTPAAINLYIEALQQARQVTGITDDNFAKLTQEIERQAKRFEEATNAANSYNSAIERQDRQARAVAEFGASPISGRRPDGKAIFGSPAFKAEGQLALQELQRANAEIDARVRREQADRTRRRKDAIGSAIIGGAFPALFGQGLGASVGGAVGGGVGGAVGGQFGFGLSLVGTAVGAQFDTLLQKGLALAQSLDDPIKNFEQLADAAVLSSKQLESYVRGLIESGRGAEAQVLIQKDLFDTFGSLQGVEDYQKSIDGLNRSWARASTIIADFVSGPLAKLLQGFTNTNNNVGTAVRYEQLVGQLTPEQYNRVQAVRDSATRQSAAASGRPGFLPPSENNVAAGRQAAISEAERLLGVDKQRAEIAAQLAAAQLRNKESISTNYRLIDAQTQGYEKQTLELQKQEALNERNRRLLELPADKRVGSPEALKIQQDTALKVYEITQRITELDQKRWAANIAAANRLKDIQEQTAIQQARPNLTGVGVGALQSLAQFRAAQRREQDAQAALRAQPGNQDLRNAAQEAAENVKQAAATTKSDLQEAFLSAQEAVRNISRSLQDGRLAYAEMVNTSGQGVNKYLGAQQVRQNQEALNPALLQQAQEAVRGYQQRTGQAVPNLSVTGTLEQRNAQLIDIARVFGQQERAVQDLALQSQELVKANNSLLTVNAALAATNTKVADALELNRAALVSLAGKDWNVYVTTPAQPMIPVPIGP